MSSQLGVPGSVWEMTAVNRPSASATPTGYVMVDGYVSTSVGNCFSEE
ncbi:hypothetical protein [Candidatus Poriferisodalis sp.]